MWIRTLSSKRENDEIRRKIFEYAGLIALLIITAIIIFRDYLFGGHYYFFEGTDSVRTTFPAYYSIARYLEDGWSWWSFNMGIGASQLSRATAFGDPFNFILLLNKDYIKELIIFVVILRSMCAGVFFYHYLNNFKFTTFSKYVGTIAYAFCGYIILMGRNYGFATVCVYLPLVLNGIEKAFQKGKYTCLTIALSLTLIYYNIMYYIMVFVVVIYYLVRTLMLHNNTWKTFFLRSMKFLCSGVTSFLLAAFWAIPVFYLTRQSPRIGAYNDQVNRFGISVDALATAISRLIGVDSLGNSEAYVTYQGYARQYMQLATYTSILAVVMILILLANYRGKAKMKYVLVIIGVVSCFLFNFFSYTLNGFSTITYRWSFAFNALLAFALVLGSEMIFQNDSFALKKSIIIYVVIFAGLYFYSIYYNINNNNETTQSLINYIDINTKNTLVPLFIMGCYFLFIILYRKKILTAKVSQTIILGLLIFEIAFSYRDWIGMSISYGKNAEKNNIEYFDDSMDFIAEIRTEDDSFYRMDKDFDSLYRYDGLPSDNDALVQNYYGLKNYSSLNPLGYTRFLQSMGIYVMCPLESVDESVVKPEDITSASVNYINGVGNRYNLKAFLGVKYFITKASDENTPPNNYKLCKSYNGINCYVTEDYNPLIFMTYYTVSDEDFRTLSEEEKDTLIFSASVTDDENSIYRTEPKNVLNKGEDIQNIMRKNQNCLSILEFDEDYICANITAEQNGILNTSISYDKGWNIYIDGKMVETFSVDNGLLACEISKGTHTVELKYFPYGMKIGVYISIGTLIVAIILKIILKKKREDQVL